ncbi:hypothetical protein BDY19DRAFT_28489 [Irpex rosettiformis]|uniref:Uncharacterized protein n=1 Tax=Irpex rosettiformis TaxID=378272 RepID=A0ACB8UJF4_9APHY|nr:hypothetical protein BDY19DRAFT_28489 [Irpex rosettiformis]
MTLTFSPALQTTTPLPVAPGGSGTFRFSASFSTREEYDRARREGTRLEMWTNLPVAGHGGSDWHSLTFNYPDDPATASSSVVDASNDKVFALPPTTAETVYLGDNTTVVLDLTLTNARPGAVYSFTYRLVYASGGIEWLGAYGRNGDLVLEEKDIRFTLAQGSTLEHGTIVNSDLNAETASVALGTLNKSIDWVCWGFSDDGTCKPSYSGLSVSPSSAVLLVPRPNDAGLVDVQPLLLKAYGGAVSVTSNGDLVRHDGLAVLDVSEAFAGVTVLPGSSIISVQSGFAVVASACKDGQDVPTSLSFIPISREAWKTSFTDIRLTEADIRTVLGSEHDEAVVVNSSVSAFGTWKVGGDLVVRVSSPGAQCVFAPVFSLPATKDEESLSLALITPSASARVEVIEEVQGSALLTPPPSPPPVPRPITTGPTSAPDVIPEVSEVPVPATPTSELQETAEDSGPIEGEKPDPSPIPTSLIPLMDKPVGASFLRFVLAFVAWLARPALEKVYGFFGGNILLWIAYRFFGSGRLEPTIAATVTEIEVMEVPDHDDIVEEDIALPAELPVEQVSPVPPVPELERVLPRSYSELTVSDGSTMISAQALPHLAIPPRQPLSINTKSHLVVNARTEIVSLLATIKSKDTSLPELDVIIDGERSRQPVKSSQLSQAVYLVEFQLPSDSTRLQVALRQ